MGSTSFLDDYLPSNVDCLVLGGGITGAGVARDAAMRGLRVLLVECNDFASGTSHLTSKVIHGGLRYLVHGHVQSVLQGIMERDRLLHQMAPNLVRPLRFVIPYAGRDFGKWLATACGLQLYGLTDLLRAGRAPLPMLGVRLRRDYSWMRPHPFAVTFWDAQTNDARLVLSTLRTAEAVGARLLNYTAITRLRAPTARAAWWTVALRLPGARQVAVVRARSLVNATGPWSPETASLLGEKPAALLWIKGSHIMLRRPHGFTDDALVIRSLKDARPLWVIPWLGRLLVGTTESQYCGDLRNVRPAAAEVDDLFASVVHFFPKAGFTRDDISCAFAGVRPILSPCTASAASDRHGAEHRLSREYRVEVSRERRLVTILGGKLTTFRGMAEDTIDAVSRLADLPPIRRSLRSHLRSAPLWPGFSPEASRDFKEELADRHRRDRIGREIIEHLVDLYGFEAAKVVRDMARRPSSARPLVEYLPYTPAEMEYLVRSEKVVHLLDLIKRRTSLYFGIDTDDFEAHARIARLIGPILGWDVRRQAEELAAAAQEYQADMAACRPVDVAEAVATGSVAASAAGA